MRRGTGLLVAMFVASAAFGGCWACVYNLTERLTPAADLCPCGEPLGETPLQADEEPRFERAGAPDPMAPSAAPTEQARRSASVLHRSGSPLTLSGE